MGSSARAGAAVPRCGFRSAATCVALAVVVSGLALTSAADAASAPPPPRFLSVAAAPRLQSWPSGRRGRIVRAAASQIGYRDHGHFCTKFGPCEEWCALFATWAWQRGGVRVPRYAFTGAMYYWAALHTHVLRPSARPKPGDAVLFGTGPRSVSSSRHVGIVQAVFPGYLVTIEGDSEHGVRRFVVPTAAPTRVGKPGRIYAYASPFGRPARAAGRAARVRRAQAARALRASARVRPSGESTVRASGLSPRARRLRAAIRSLRAFQHMPYVAGGVKIGWVGVDPQGMVDVAVISHGPLAPAQSAWQTFLARWGDRGTAYAVTFYTAP